MLATSREPDEPPPASVLRIMSANCSTSASRPIVLMVNWKDLPVGDRGLADLAGRDLRVLLLDGP